VSALSSEQPFPVRLNSREVVVDQSVTPVAHGNPGSGATRAFELRRHAQESRFCRHVMMCRHHRLTHDEFGGGNRPQSKLPRRRD